MTVQHQTDNLDLKNQVEGLKTLEPVLTWLLGELMM